MLKLICFLGNPGTQYEKTRHNAGWLLLEHLSFSSHLVFTRKFKGEYSDIELNGHSYFILKPLTFMNLSGESLQSMAHFFKIKPDECLVVYDDIEMPFGTISLKKGGGLGGHNGLKSITKHMNSQDFYRFKIGISQPSRGQVSGHVLGKFTPDEQAVLPLYLEKAAEHLESCLMSPKTINSIKNNKLKILN